MCRSPQNEGLGNPDLFAFMAGRPGEWGVHNHEIERLMHDGKRTTKVIHIFFSAGHLTSSDVHQSSSTRLGENGLVRNRQNKVQGHQCRRCLNCLAMLGQYGVSAVRHHAYKGLFVPDTGVGTGQH